MTLADRAPSQQIIFLIDRSVEIGSNRFLLLVKDGDSVGGPVSVGDEEMIERTKRLIETEEVFVWNFSRKIVI